jgi:hypothetical protein
VMIRIIFCARLQILSKATVRDNKFNHIIRLVMCPCKLFLVGEAWVLRRDGCKVRVFPVKVRQGISPVTRTGEPTTMALHSKEADSACTRFLHLLQLRTTTMTTSLKALSKSFLMR